MVKTPQYLLRISDIPIYMLTDDEDQPQVIPQPGQRVSTTNILTRMWMTYGGWEHQSEDFPYFKNNDKDAYPDLMYDGWKPAKMDSVGSDNRTIDGFKVASFGEQNPTAENVFSWNQNDKNTFALPVRGAYLKERHDRCPREQHEARRQISAAPPRHVHPRRDGQERCPQQGQ